MRLSAFFLLFRGYRRKREGFIPRWRRGGGGGSEGKEGANHISSLGARRARGKRGRLVSSHRNKRNDLTWCFGAFRAAVKTRHFPFDRESVVSIPRGHFPLDYIRARLVIPCGGHHPRRRTILAKVQADVRS